MLGCRRQSLCVYFCRWFIDALSRPYKQKWSAFVKMNHGENSTSMVELERGLLFRFSGRKTKPSLWICLLEKAYIEIFRFDVSFERSWIKISIWAKKHFSVVHLVALAIKLARRMPWRCGTTRAFVRFLARNFLKASWHRCAPKS